MSSALLSLGKTPNHKGQIWALTMLLLSAFVSILPAQTGPHEREIYYGVMHGEDCYGSQRVHVSKLEDGNFRFELTMRVLVDFFGQKQESKSKHEYIVTAALRPVSLKIESSDLSGVTKMSGSVHDGLLRVRMEGHGQSNTKTVVGFEDAIFSANLVDWLAGLSPKVDKATVETIDETDWELVTATASCVRREASGVTWEVQLSGGVGVRVMSLDANGDLLEDVSRAPNVHVVRSTKAETKDLVYRKMTGRDVLGFPLDKEISAPHRLEHLQIRLTWDDIPFEEFHLQDMRQRVISHTTKSGEHSVVLEIGKPPPLKRVEQSRLLVEDAAFAAFLAPTNLIKPKNKDILAVAREATRGKADALEVVRALSEWVHSNIEPELMTTTLSGPEVLATRKGKCTEFSTLYASLARSLGLPTRIVLGERMISGQWGGHMWNEVWIGQWVTVDAGANEVGESMALLKFIHSDTVMGTQQLRWKLTESLEIAIEEFRLRPSALDGRYKTGVSGRLYTNVDYACSLEGPEGWTLQDKSATGSTTIRFKSPDTNAVSLHFVAFSVPVGTLAKPIAISRINGVESRFDSCEVSKNAVADVSGCDGHIVCVSGLTKQVAPVAYVVTEVVWIRGACGFLLTMSAPKGDHANCLPSFDRILKSFQSLE